MSEDRVYAVAEAESVIYIARGSGLYWRSSVDGAENNLYHSWRPGESIATLDIAASDGLLLAGIHGAVARSEDHGQNWTAKPIRRPAPLITCLELSPNFTRDGIALAGTYQDGLFHSRDRGQTWTPSNFGLFDHSIYCLALSPAYPRDGTVFVGTSSGLYRSENGGRYWQDLPTPANEATLSLSLSPAFPNDGIILAGSESRGLLRSHDKGRNWQTFYPCDKPINAIIHLPSAHHLAIQIEDAVLACAPDHDEWQTIAASDVHAIAASADGQALLIALASGQLHRATL